MRRRVFLVTVLVALLAAPAQAGTHWQKMNLLSARVASRLTAEDIAVPFGETKPRIRIACRLTSETRADCHVRIHAQRLNATFDTWVRWREKQGYCWARNLRSREAEVTRYRR